jgi:hypothetical protein
LETRVSICLLQRFHDYGCRAPFEIVIRPRVRRDGGLRWRANRTISFTRTITGASRSGAIASPLTIAHSIAFTGRARRRPAWRGFRAAAVSR